MSCETNTPMDFPDFSNAGMRCSSINSELLSAKS